MKVEYDEIFITQIKTTCWENDESLKNKEIIEFGGCLLNIKTLRTSEAINLLIKPRSEVSDFCTKKTGISREDAESGIEFRELIPFIIENYNVEKRAWASYGSFAQHVFQSQCKKNNIKYPFNDRFLNIKSWLPVIFTLKHEISLKEAIKRLNLEIPEPEDSMDDALNAAIVLKEALRGAVMPCLTKKH